MALKLFQSTDYGFDVPDAYHKVRSISLEKTRMNFQVSIYAKADKNAFQHKSYSCAYDLNGANPIAQAYEHLKSLPEFAGATDC